MESHGAGVQLLCSASLALEMGVPIYGVLVRYFLSFDLLWTELSF